MGALDDPRVEPLARVLCEADRHNPDDEVLDAMHPFVGAKGRIVLTSFRTMPSWQLYVYQAAAALAHFDAMADA